MTKILILAGSPFKKEKTPFSSSATYLIKQCLDNVGITDYEAVFANNSTHTLKRLLAFHKPNILIAVGEKSLQEVTSEKGIDTFRGYILESTLQPGLKVLPIYDPLMVHKNFETKYPVVLQDLRKAKRFAENAEFPVNDETLIINPPAKQILDHLDYLQEHAEAIACDIEAWAGHITWISFAHTSKFCLNFRFFSSQGPSFSFPIETQIWQKLNKLLTTKYFIWHNAQYDCSVLYKNNGIYPRHDFDTMVAAHVLDPILLKSLKFVSSYYLDVMAWKHTSKDNMGLYNALDSINTFRLYEVFKKKLAEENLEKFFDFKMREIEPAMFCGLNGIRIDKEKQAMLVEKLQHEIKTMQENLASVTELDCINYASPQQLAGVLYEWYGFTKQYKKKAIRIDKNLSTDIQALKALVEEDTYFLIDKLIKLRKKVKLLQFVKIKTDEFNKVYTSYNTTGVESFRWSSSKSIINPYGSGNHQNVPLLARIIYIGD